MKKLSLECTCIILYIDVLLRLCKFYIHCDAPYSSRTGGWCPQRRPPSMCKAVVGDCALQPLAAGKPVFPETPNYRCPVCGRRRGGACDALTVCGPVLHLAKKPLMYCSRRPDSPVMGQICFGCRCSYLPTLATMLPMLPPSSCPFLPALSLGGPRGDIRTEVKIRPTRGHPWGNDFCTLPPWIASDKICPGECLLRDILQ